MSDDGSDILDVLDDIDVDIDDDDDDDELTDAMDRIAREEGVDCAEGDQVDFDLRLTEDRLAVVIDFMDPNGNIGPILFRMEKSLEKLDLDYVPPREGLEAWLNATLENGPPFMNLRLLEGEPPIDPVNGHIKWQDDYFATGFVEQGHDSVDYMRRAEKLSVHDGDLLAVLHPPVDGEAGVDLFGEAITVPSAERVAISSGTNVRKVENEDGTVSFYSEIDGRLRWVSEVLSVDDVYVVNGDVGLETGDIEHAGALTVAGDIKAGARLKVEGDITVKGMVEPCSIVCGGNLAVEGGIIGSEEYSIVVKGGLTARYISEATIEALEDVVITNEILNTRLRTLGAVQISEGRIIGGEISAHVEIVAGQVGSEGRVPTKLICGRDFHLEAELEGPKEKAKAYEEALGKSNIMVAKAMQATDPLPEAVFEELMKRHDQIEAKFMQWQDRIDRIVARSEARSKYIIIITSETYSDVLFEIKSSRKLTKRYINTARRISCRQGDIRMQPMGFKT